MLTLGRNEASKTQEKAPAASFTVHGIFGLGFALCSDISVATRYLSPSDLFGDSEDSCRCQAFSYIQWGWVRLKQRVKNIECELEKSFHLISSVGELSKFSLRYSVEDDLIYVGPDDYDR